MSTVIPKKLFNLEIGGFMMVFPFLGFFGVVEWTGHLPTSNLGSFHKPQGR